MIECPNCHQMTREGKYCMNCGHNINSESYNSPNQNHIHDYNNDIRTYDSNVTTQEDNYQQYNNDYQQNQENLQYHTYNNQQDMDNQSNTTVAGNHKSKLVGFILNFFIPGLGYGYVNRWKDAIIFIIVYYVLWLLGFVLFFPWIITFILWIYVIFKVNGMIDKYNKGLPY